MQDLFSKSLGRMLISIALKSLVTLQPPFPNFQIQALLCKYNIKIPRKFNYLKLLRIHDTMKSIQAVLS